MITSLTELCRQVGDLCFGWVLVMPRDLAVATLGVLLAAGLLVIRVTAVDRAKLLLVQRDRQRLRELNRQAVLDGDQVLKVRTIQVARLVAAQRLRLESGMLVASVLLSALITIWGSDRLFYLPIRGGDTVRVEARFPASFVGQLAHVVPMDGVDVAEGWVQRIEGGYVRHQPAGIAAWTLRWGADRTQGWIVVRCGNDTVVHPVTVNSNHYEPPVRMHPGGLETEVGLTPYRPLQVVPATVFLMVPGWIVWMTIVAAVTYGLGTITLRFTASYSARITAGITPGITAGR